MKHGDIVEDPLLKDQLPCCKECGTKCVLVFDDEEGYDVNYIVMCPECLYEWDYWSVDKQEYLNSWYEKKEVRT